MQNVESFRVCPDCHLKKLPQNQTHTKENQQQETNKKPTANPNTPIH